MPQVFLLQVATLAIRLLGERAREVKVVGIGHVELARALHCRHYCLTARSSIKVNAALCVVAPLRIELHLGSIARFRRLRWPDSQERGSTIVRALCTLCSRIIILLIRVLYI